MLRLFCGVSLLWGYDLFKSALINESHYHKVEMGLEYGDKVWSAIKYSSNVLGWSAFEYGLAANLLCNTGI